MKTFSNLLKTLKKDLKINIIEERYESQKNKQ